MTLPSDFFDVLRNKAPDHPDLVLKTLHSITNKQDQQEVIKHFKTKQGFLDWIDTTCVMFDPDHNPNYRKFILFPLQKKEIADWIYPLIADENPDPETKVWEKSRRVGWTNTMLCAMTYAAVFYSRSSIIATKDLAAADSLNDPHNSLLPRIRTLMQYQPRYLYKNYGSIQKKILINEATIIGVPTATPESASKLGRSGRVRFVMFDEAGFWRSSNLEQAFQASSMTAKVRILLSSASNTNSHFFSRLVDGNAIESVKGTWIPFESNPSNTVEYLEQLKLKNTKEFIDQEVFGKRGGSITSIIVDFDKNSFSSQGSHYTLDHEFIKFQLKHEGHFFVAIDGGMEGSHTGVILGYHVYSKKRDVLLYEFSNLFPKEDIRLVVERAENKLKELKDLTPLANPTLYYGDPALRTYQDDKLIYEVTGKPINTLDSLRKQSTFGRRGQENSTFIPIPEVGEIYSNRKVNRINLLKRKLRRIDDNDRKPELIWIPKNCSNFHGGIVEGKFEWQKNPTTGIITNEIAQNHPLTDIIDAYTYKLLEKEYNRSFKDAKD